MLKPRFLVLVGIIFFAAFLRLVPHPYNLTPITAMALFGGAHFSKKRDAYFITLGAMLLSDLILGFYSLVPLVYGCFILIILIGSSLRKRRTPVMTLGAALSGSILFFTVTNFGVWVFQSLYPKTLEGLLTCYAAAIPFFQNALLGDLAYTILLFGGLALAEKRFPVLQEPALGTVR